MACKVLYCNGDVRHRPKYKHHRTRKERWKADSHGLLLLGCNYIGVNSDAKSNRDFPYEYLINIFEQSLRLHTKEDSVSNLPFLIQPLFVDKHNSHTPHEFFVHANSTKSDLLNLSILYKKVIRSV